MILVIGLRSNFTAALNHLCVKGGQIRGKRCVFLSAHSCGVGLLYINWSDLDACVLPKFAANVLNA